MIPRFSKPPATPGTPVGPKPPGPTHPTPTGPPPRIGGQRLPLDLVVGMADTLLAYVLNLIDGDLDPASFPADRDLASMRLTSAAFHLDRALAELGHLQTPARQSFSDAAAVGAPEAGEPVKPYWHDLLRPADFELPAAPPVPSFDGMAHLYDCCSAAPTQPHTADCGLSPADSS